MPDLILPALKSVASPNYSSRGGAKIAKIIAHDCEGSYVGSVSWFAQARSQVSAHIILRDDGLEATQMVAFANKAWHVCNFNPSTIGVEMAGFAAKGFQDPEWQAGANIIAFLLRKYDLPCQWARGGSGAGFCSHADLGAAGGGHHDPTESSAVWASFVARVQAAYALPMPATWSSAGAAVAAPPAPAGYTPSASVRHDLAVGSLEWVQARLNALGYPARGPLVVDGMMGPATEQAVAAFQSARHLFVDGDPGPQTIAALA